MHRSCFPCLVNILEIGDVGVYKRIYMCFEVLVKK